METLTDCYSGLRQGIVVCFVDIGGFNIQETNCLTFRGMVYAPPPETDNFSQETKIRLYICLHEKSVFLPIIPKISCLKVQGEFIYFWHLSGQNIIYWPILKFK